MSSNAMSVPWQKVKCDWSMKKKLRVVGVAIEQRDVDIEALVCRQRE